MSEAEEPTTGAPDTAPEQDNPTPATTRIETLEEALAELKKTRAESASRRIENKKQTELNKKLTERLEALEKSQTDAQTKELAEQNKFKELAEQFQKKAEQLEAQLKTKEIEVLRVRVAAEFGLNVPLDGDSGETLADRLRGDTLDDLRADAEKLARLFKRPEAGTPPDAPPKGTEPPPQPEPGKTPTTTSVPGGPPVGRTDQDRKRTYINPLQASPIFDTNLGGAQVNTQVKPVRKE